MRLCCGEQAQVFMFPSSVPSLESLKSDLFPDQALVAAQQLLLDKDLPSSLWEHRGDEGLEAALEHRSMAKETVKWMLSLNDLILHVLCFA